MRISAINPIRNNYFINNRPVSFKQGQDIFVKTTEQKSFMEIINEKRKFDISDYKTLSNKEIERRKKLI